MDAIKLVNLWLLGKARKVDQSAEGVTLNYGGTKYYLTWEQVGAAFSILGKSKAVLESFIAKQFGYRPERENLQMFRRRIGHLGFSELGDFSGISDFLTAAGKAWDSYANWQAARVKAKAAQAQAQAQAQATEASKTAQFLQAKTITTIATIGIIGLIAIVMLKKRSK